MSAREEIAQAASTVAGLHVTPRYRSQCGPGEGIVRLARKARAENGFGYVDTWQVWIGLAQSLADAEKWIEARADELLDALDDEMTVTALTPAEIVLIPGGPSIPGVIVEGTREA